MIDQLKTYRRFVTSYYLTEGLRITSALMIPVLLFYHYNYLSLGMSFILGVLCVSITDNPGPLHHRQNGMNITIVLLFLTSLITGFSVNVPWLLFIELAIFSFFFSMIGVYGVRAGSVGISVLFMMVLSIDERFTPKEILINATLVMLGGIWYFFWSLLLHRLRPYKLAQQAIGDSILSTAKYLRVKASLYSRSVDYDKSYRALFEEQVQVQHKQDLVQDILFKTRSIVKESTHTGRVLVMTYLDVVDLFENIMTSQRDYKGLHEAFEPGMLDRLQKCLLLMANELEEIGEAIQQGTKSYPSPGTGLYIKETEQFYLSYRQAHLTANNLNDFMGLRHIIESIKEVFGRMETLHRYTTYDKSLKTQTKLKIDYNEFVSPTELNPKLFWESLNIHANVFRHSIRVSVCIMIGYILSKFLPVGHSYWILLTILVILKPAYGLTRKRNYQRLLGTFIGAAVGVIVLFITKDKTALVIIMIIGMIGAYSLMRIQYMLCVVCMTTYLLISFYLLKPITFNTMVTDRVIDTAIGSILAFTITLIIPPKWEHEQIRTLLQKTINANAAYFKYIADAFTGKIIQLSQYKILRKEVYVTMANISDAFQRMLSEPKSKQKNSVTLYQLVVSNHLLASHNATLSSYTTKFAAEHGSEEFVEIINKTMQHLRNAVVLLDEATPADQPLIPVKAADTESFTVRQRLDLLLEQRKSEIGTESFKPGTRPELSALKTITDQFIYVYKISVDIEKLAFKMRDEVN